MAQLKNTTVSDTGFLQLPVGTTAQRPSPAAGQLRYNTNTGKAEFYNATAAAWLGTAATGVVATGGTVYDVDTEGTTYRVHVFTNTGNTNFVVTKGGEVEYLIVAGGGGGGTQHGGGGGAGGVIIGTTTVTNQSYVVTVGNGGGGSPPGGSFTRPSGGDGGQSVFSTITSTGGGGGSSITNPVTPGRPGGSGGGCALAGAGAGSTGTGGTGNTPSVSPSQGNAGGAYTGYDGSLNYGGGGGGGGASTSGQSSPGSPVKAGNGGNGMSSFISGTLVTYAGGGGGGSHAPFTFGLGGLGGGGNGGLGNNASPTGDGTPGTINLGGGGGGGGAMDAKGGNGGSGIVIIRYPLRQENPVTAAGKVVGDGLVLDLDFAKPTVYVGTGTVVTDSRLNGIAGTLNNGPVFTDSRTHRSSFKFNGSNTYIQIPNTINSTGTYSVIQWVRPSTPLADVGYQNSTGRRTPLVGPGPVWNPGYWITASTFRVHAHTEYRDININLVGNTGWHQIGQIFDGTTCFTILDGQVLLGTRTSYSIAIPTQILIGAETTTGSAENWLGDIATTTFYNRVLSDSEVAQQYNANRWRFGV